MAFLCGFCFAGLIIEPVCTAKSSSQRSPSSAPTKAWSVLETQHFLIHHQPSQVRTAKRIASAAEDVLPEIARDFGVAVEKKIPVVLDRRLLFNGQAEPIKDRIYLDPHLAASSVIGARRFIAHELTHVMTFLALGRDGVLSKLSNLSGLPSWFLEGIAQYEAEYWSASNDRMLRLHTLDDTLLTTTERENFALLGADFGAAGYNEGYSLTRYFFETYGRDKIAKLFAILRQGQEANLGRAVYRLTGQHLEAIEAAWQNVLKEQYQKQTIDLRRDVPGSQPVVRSVRGEVNYSPRLSPDGKHLAYLSSRHHDSYLYLRGHVIGFLGLIVADSDGARPSPLPVGNGRSTSFSWSPDSKQLVVAAAVEDAQGYPTTNLFLCDADGKNARQLTQVVAATDPAWRPGSSEIAFVETVDTKSLLKVVDAHTAKVRALGLEMGDRQLADLSWSGDGKMLAASAHIPGEGGKLVLIEVLDPGHRKNLIKVKALKNLSNGPPHIADVAPTWLPDGKSLIFASTRDGMENLYRLSLDQAKMERLTMVFSGAAKPHVAPDGKNIYWASYRDFGTEIRSASLPLGMPMVHTSPNSTESWPQESSWAPKAYGSVGEGVIHPYEPRMSVDLIIPQVTSDERGQQVGLMALYSDVLENQQLGLDVRFGLMSQRFSYSANYVNRVFELPWGLSLFDSPTVGIPDRISPETLSQSLYWERQRGLQGRVVLGQFTLGTTFSYVTALTQPDPNLGVRLRQGRLNTVSLAWSERRTASTFDSDINPTGGYQFTTQTTLADSLLGSEFNFLSTTMSYNRYIPIFPDWRHNLKLALGAGMTRGDAPPFFVGGNVGVGPLTALRGYLAGEDFGERLVFVGTDYTFPIRSHLDYQLGPIYFDKLYGSFFAEGADAWREGGRAELRASTGAEIRLRLALSGRQVILLRLGVAYPLGDSRFDWMPYFAF